MEACRHHDSMACCRETRSWTFSSQFPRISQGSRHLPKNVQRSSGVTMVLAGTEGGSPCLKRIFSEGVHDLISCKRLYCSPLDGNSCRMFWPTASQENRWCYCKCMRTSDVCALLLLLLACCFFAAAGHLLPLLLDETFHQLLGWDLGARYALLGVVPSRLHTAKGELLLENKAPTLRQ